MRIILPLILLLLPVTAFAKDVWFAFTPKDPEGLVEPYIYVPAEIKTKRSTITLQDANDFHRRKEPDSTVLFLCVHANPGGNNLSIEPDSIAVFIDGRRTPASSWYHEAPWDIVEFGEIACYTLVFPWMRLDEIGAVEVRTDGNVYVLRKVGKLK